MISVEVDAVADRLAGSFRGVVARDRPLARLTTYRLGGNAAMYVEPVDAADLDALADALEAADEIPVLTLGRGSNLVISDRGWPGVVIRLPGACWSWIESAEHDDVTGLRSGAATSLPLLANWAARRGLAGIEFLVAVPGSVGGAVKMNAGAHGREIKDCLVTVQVFDLMRFQTEDRGRDALELSYRHSRLSERELVLEATLALEPAGVDEVRDRMDSYRRHRAQTQPGAVQNAGSVFKNPPGDHAGRLVEAAGLKGFRIGGAAVSDLHANFFVAGDDATAQDVFELVHAVRAQVNERFGVELEPEIRFAGEFQTSPEGVVG